MLGIKQDLLLEHFEFLDTYENTEQFIEIGSYFWIKKKLTFEETDDLIVSISNLLKKESTNRISRFEEVRDQKFCDDALKPGLSVSIFNDSQRIYSGNTARLDFDFVHPQKLLLFYECDSFQAFYKNGKSPIVTTEFRNEIYHDVLFRIRNDHGDINQFDFNAILWGIQVKGFKGTEEVTKAPFITHINCEYRMSQISYFYLDNKWYEAKGDFIQTINSECRLILKAKHWNDSSLRLPWNILETEGEYNLSYLNESGFIVLDRMLGQNIELCDLLYETDNTIYLIHVKAGFDAKMRDLTNQILISSTRLSNDLTTNKAFILEVFNAFKDSTNNVNNIDEDYFLRLFDKKIEYVLAYCPTGTHRNVLDNIDQFASNVAKFSIISISREMATNNFALNIVELSNARGT